MPIHRYDDALLKFQQEPATVLYLDTCILLDIIRSPIRDTIAAESVQFAKFLLERSNHKPKSLWLVTSETVALEWEEHADEIVKEVEREILKLESKRSHMLTAAKAATEIDYLHGQAVNRINLAQTLKAISKSVLDTCIVIPPENEHSLAAMDRVKKYRAPAKRGKAEPKDCEIYEVFLSLCRDLQEKEVKLIFASSNTNDYGEKNSGGIEQELSAVNAKYATCWNWVNAVLEERA